MNMSFTSGRFALFLKGQGRWPPRIIRTGWTDKILTDDLVSLQKLLDQQARRNPAVGDIF